MRFLNVVFFLALAGPTLADEPPLAPAACKSLMETLSDNYAAMESYDVLVDHRRTTQTVDTADDGKADYRVIERHAYRVALLEEGRATAISIRRIQNFARKTDWMKSISLVCVPGSCRHCDFVNPQRKSKNIAPEGCLAAEDICNVKMIGFSVFPEAKYGYIIDLHGDFLDKIGQYGEGQIHEGKTNIKVEFPFSEKNGPQSYSSRWEYEIDNDSRMPTKHKRTNLVKDMDGNITERSWYDASIVWMHHESRVYLPRTMLIRKYGMELDGKGNAVPLVTTSRVRFRWFSVNSEIDDQMWNADRWQDFTLAQEACKYYVSASSKNE